MGEGPAKKYPSKNDPHLSPEISLFDQAQNLISGAVFAVAVTYPDVHPSVLDVLDTVHRGPLTNAVNAGERALQANLAAWTRGCRLSQLKIALVGYSMGAWVITKWLKDHPEDWVVVRAVVLYGDPCFNSRTPAGAGLARLFGAEGCNPARSYPYPEPTPLLGMPFKAQAYCLVRDPVCGRGFRNKQTQLKRAVRCSKKNHCPHLAYTKGAPRKGDLAAGARFVVKQLLG